MRQPYKRLFLSAGLLSLAVIALTGCADQYSSAVDYQVRTDPVFMLSPDQIAKGEWPTPDQPGQLPLMSLKLINNPENPYSRMSAESMEKLRANAFDPRNLSDNDRSSFHSALNKLFGTPQAPKLHKSIATKEQLKKLKLEPETLAFGSQIYRLQCLTCHGLTGDGRGYTSHWVNPHPRDYRLGLFKFQSVDQSDGELRKPLREDLYRTLYRGVEGTSMPSFNLLPEEELQALVSYVIFLSIRGESEYLTMKSGLQQKGDGVVFSTKLLPVRGSIDKTLAKSAQLTIMNWVDAQSKPIPDSSYPYANANEEEMRASVQRGYAMFIADGPRFQKYLPAEKYAKEYPGLFPKVKKDGKEVIDEENSAEAIKKFVTSVRCAQCHYDFGRRAEFSFDSWGTLRRPANLTTGVFRGGRRPIDIYWRIHSGINGSGMISYKNAGLKEEQIWDIVNFVRALPYPAMRKLYKIDID